jgi:hypothetical protein
VEKSAGLGETWQSWQVTGTVSRAQQVMVMATVGTRTVTVMVTAAQAGS